MRTDPIGLKGGDVNLYGYVGWNPSNLIDPNGLVVLTPEQALNMWKKVIDWWTDPYWIPGTYGATVALNNFSIDVSKGCKFICWGIASDLIGIGYDTPTLETESPTPFTGSFGLSRRTGIFSDGGGVGASIGGSAGLPGGGFSVNLICKSLSSGSKDNDGCPCENNTPPSVFSY